MFSYNYIRLLKKQKVKKANGKLANKAVIKIKTNLMFWQIGWIMLVNLSFAVVIQNRYSFRKKKIKNSTLK
jgi:hypothetical protein